MRYPATEKLEIIRLVEQSHLSTRQTLDKLGIPAAPLPAGMPATSMAGPRRWKTALRRRAGWNRLPDDVRKQIIDMALENSELSPRELATKFTDEKQYFVCEATVYRLLKAQDLIASPAYIVIKARDEFHTKTTRPNEMWQTDFTYFKLIGWGWVYLSTVLDDYSATSSRGSCAPR
jgi:transposase InsO family protein